MKPVRPDGSGRRRERSGRTIEPMRHRQGMPWRGFAVNGAGFGGLDREGRRRREGFRARVSLRRTGEIARARERAHARRRPGDPGRDGIAGNDRLQGDRLAQDGPIANVAAHRLRRARIDEDTQRPEEGKECHAASAGKPRTRHVRRTLDSR